MAVVLLAFGWGFAEATLFFIVADVVISVAAARHGWRVGLYAALAAAAGATLGGVCLAGWAMHSPETALAWVENVPAISPGMVTDLRSSIEDQSTLGLLTVLIKASVTGVPYKIAAVTATGVSIPMWLLALITPVVRLPRFVAAAVGGALLRRWTPSLSGRARLSVVVVGWVLFYAAYWAVMPN